MGSAQEQHPRREAERVEVDERIDPAHAVIRSASRSLKSAYLWALIRATTGW